MTWLQAVMVTGFGALATVGMSKFESANEVKPSVTGGFFLFVASYAIGYQAGESAGLVSSGEDVEVVRDVSPGARWIIASRVSQESLLFLALGLAIGWLYVAHRNRTKTLATVEDHKNLRLSAMFYAAFVYLLCAAFAFDG